MSESSPFRVAQARVLTKGAVLYHIGHVAEVRLCNWLNTMPTIHLSIFKNSSDTLEI